ncbi:MAG: S-layer homology domain-containing protein [Clostridia bacterium]|nr:S-layer homology domain-containing protein [Clostridia bacterium]
MKKIISVISFVLVLVMLTSAATVFGAEAKFKDFDYPAQYGWDGYPDGSFHPEKVITRAELTSYLYKLGADGVFEFQGVKYGKIEPIRKYNDNFSDVSPKKWYYSSVVWAYECGIVNGVGNGKFDPDSTITVFEYALVMKRFYDAVITEEFTETAESYFEYFTYPLAGGENNYKSDIAYWELINSDRGCERLLSNAVLIDLPAWFLKETDLKEIIKYDIWIGGDYEHVDMTQFSPTRGELYKHSHGFYVEAIIYS